VLAPRLLDVAGAARYLSVSPWTIKALLANGTLSRVTIPLSGGRDLRRTLLDRLQIDELALRWRDRA